MLAEVLNSIDKSLPEAISLLEAEFRIRRDRIGDKTSYTISNYVLAHGYLKNVVNKIEGIKNDCPRDATTLRSCLRFINRNLREAHASLEARDLWIDDREEAIDIQKAHSIIKRDIQIITRFINRPVPANYTLDGDLTSNKDYPYPDY